jgi:hypothetical protein
MRPYIDRRFIFLLMDLEVDVDEFICAKTLSKRHRRLTWKEISSLIERIKLRQFPFGDAMGEIIDYTQSMGLFPY